MTAPLVSVLIPVRSARFFEAALASALAQVSVDIEVIVSDDSEGDDVEMIVKQYEDERISYVRNVPPLGFHGNFANCYTLARGKYLKFLNHDDLLYPECASRMVALFDNFGERITLACCRRRIIDESGAYLADSAATRPLSEKDSILAGKSFGNHLLTRSVNLIGEPSAVMFRKFDINLLGGGPPGVSSSGMESIARIGTLFRIRQHEYTCLADLALWLRLLAQGDMAYLAEPLSNIRMHAGQLQQSDEVAARCMAERFYLPKEARTLGFLEDEGQYAGALRNGINLVRLGLSSPGVTPAARLIFEQAEREISGG